MVQCFIMNEEESGCYHEIVVLYQFANKDYGIDDFIYIKKYDKGAKEFKTNTIFISRNFLKSLVENPKLKLEAD